MKIETFFQDLAWTENLFIQDERLQDIFNMLKPFVNVEDLELATTMGDPTLVIPIWLGRHRQSLKKKRKEKLKKTLRRILSSQNAHILVTNQPKPSSVDQNKRVLKADVTHDDVVAPKLDLSPPLPNLDPIPTAEDPDIIMEDTPRTSRTPPRASKKKNKQKLDQIGHVLLHEDTREKMEGVIYTSAESSPESSPDLTRITQTQPPVTPAVPDPETLATIQEFDLMHLDDLNDTATQSSASNKPLEGFETFNKLKNSFTPDLKKVVEDTEAIGRTAHFSAEGFFYTTKQVRKPSAFLKDIKDQERKANTSMHEDRRPVMDTYDAFLDLNSFSAYDNNMTEKICFLELNMRKFRGYLEIFHAAKEKHIVIKFDSYEAMRHAVSIFNQFFNNSGLLLKMKKYYSHQNRRISTKEFKILHVPVEFSDDMIKEDIRSALRGIPFYIRATGGAKVSNKIAHKTVFFTVKDPADCHIIKNQWCITLQNKIFKMCPAYFSDHDLKERKRYQAEFTGFDASHSMVKVLEVLSMHNPKNAYRQSDTKIIVEYEQEAELFNACEHAIYFSSYKVIGSPRDYPCWIFNKKPLVKSPVVLPVIHETNNKTSINQDNIP